jgi:hypothetical protein
MTRRRRIAVLAAVAALSMSACTNQDSDIDDVRDALDETEGLSREQVSACTDGFEAADFSQDELNEIANADELSELPNDLGDEVNTILEDCITGSTTTAEGSGEPSESTTSTTAP